MRDEYLKSLGIVVIHFDVDEIRIQMQNVLDIIEKVIINSYHKITLIRSPFHKFCRKSMQLKQIVLCAYYL